MNIFSVAWHFWIGPGAIGISLITVIASIVLYLNSVTAKRYPRD